MNTLLTKRLILRLFKEEDLEDFYDYAKVEGVGEKAGWPHHKSIDETRQVLKAFLTNKDVYAIVLKENNKVIGSLGLHDRLNQEGVRDVGYVLNKDYWGKGIMTEAVKRLISYAFDELHMTKLTCGHFKENMASCSIIKKMNFRLIEEGLYYSAALKQFFHDFKYELTKEHYLTNINAYKE
ncbi:GNAT family N-acetyltransferase [Liberiplasma polymorphum]|jgi:[ribosomal protein S5]-alanine N-acetyltransferase|uniref:GNAT family N-acetyltransferase n=1 Tax=Liberiplasma polymorphum TaxID=3374570 RepID=UPI003773CADF